MALLKKSVKQNMKSLVIAEKRQMADNIAAALKCSCTADGYIEGDKYVITWTNGQLFTLKNPEDYDTVYKDWRLEVLPFIPNRFELKLRNDIRKKKQFNVIKELINREDIKDIIMATDAAREGQIIGRYVLEQAKNEKPVLRFWSSSLTKEAILQGFKELKADYDYDGLYNCARARAELDYLLGINFSRAYSIHNKTRISVGRCITAILALICRRDEEIERFNGEYYSEVIASFSPGYVGKYIRDNETKLSKETAIKIKAEVEDQEGEIIALSKKQESIGHPLLFNLTEVQRACSRKYDYTPMETVEALENLYLIHKIIGYPRAASQFITNKEAAILPDVFKVLSFGKFKEYADKCLKLKKLNLSRVVNEELVSDHPAIIPVVNEEMESKYNLLKEKEKNVFDEVVKRFFAVFYDDYKYESIKLKTQVKSHCFESNLIKVIDAGWRKVYKRDLEEFNEEIFNQELKVNQIFQVINVNVNDKKTKPAPHYTDDTILEVMQNPKRLVEEEKLKAAIKGHGIGTEATRADLIESLIEKEYVERKQKKLLSTELGRRVIKCIDIELLKSVELTADLEFNLEKIARNELDKELFMKEAIKFITSGVNHIKDSEHLPEVKVNKPTLGLCPRCKEGRIVKNKGGYGCTNLKNGCKFYISEVISGTYISEHDVKKLLRNQRTDMMNFKGDKEDFRARIVFNCKTKKTEFSYK